MRFSLLTFFINIFLSQQLYAADLSECGAGVYCQIPGEYRPALVFGAGQSGIRSVRQGVTQNKDLIADILAYQLTTDPDHIDTRTLGGRFISAKINSSYDLPSAPFLEPLPMQAVGYVLNPELFSSDQGSSTATLNQISYPKRTVGSDTFSGVKIDNFSLKDVNIDLSKFASADNSNSSIKICAQVKLDIKTSLELNFKARNDDYKVALENIDLVIDTKDSEQICYEAVIDMQNFNVSSIERIGSKPLLQRKNIDNAFKSQDLKITLPSTTPLSRLGRNDLNSITAGYLAPVLAEKSVATMIEAPILQNLRDVLKDQVNTVISATLSNETNNMPEINLPMFNISNAFLTQTLNDHIDGIENLSGNMKCSEFIDRMKNMDYWIRQNPSFKDVTTSSRMNQMLSSINPQNHPCKRKSNFASSLSSLKQATTSIAPTPEQTEQILIKQLMSVGEKGNMSIEIIIPVLCQGNYTSALAGREPPAHCDDFYSMLDLSYVNNYLSDQISKGNLCGQNLGGKCGIRMDDGDGSDYVGGERPKFSCKDMDSIGMSALGGSNMRATISLKGCQANGRRSLINLGLWRLGSFENTDMQLSYDVKLSKQCPNNKPVCFKIKFRDDLFSYQGELEDATFEGKITDALKEEMKALEDSLNETMANFPIEEFTAGLEITDLFGGPANETSPGYLGACLKTSGVEGSRNHVCTMAKRLLPVNHPSLVRYCE